MIANVIFEAKSTSAVTIRFYVFYMIVLVEGNALDS